MLSKLLGSASRAAVVRSLFVLGTPRYHLRELSRRTGLSVPCIQRELRLLQSMGLLEKEVQGQCIRYVASAAHPLYAVLCELVSKTEGVEAVLREAFSQSAVRFAFIFGSFARGEAHVGSDVDLFVVGDCGLREVMRCLHEGAKRLPYEVNPFVITPHDLLERIRSKEHFVLEVLTGSKIFIKGTEDEFSRMEAEWLVEAT